MLPSNVVFEKNCTKIPENTIMVDDDGCNNNDVYAILFQCLPLKIFSLVPN